MALSKLHKYIVKKSIGDNQLKEASDESVGDSNTVVISKDIKQHLYTKFIVNLSKIYINLT